MNKWIKKELQKCKVQLPEWDDNTTLMVITPKIHYVSKLNVNDELTIEIKDYIINEPSNFTLSSN